ncbi:hypothetical protein AN958_02809 [Leucoagaricus sp. SymC.cos]|nr:hypothetical protein AN958_02809 [Leucoagaricus sp. SymC.cos]
MFADGRDQINPAQFPAGAWRNREAQIVDPAHLPVNPFEVEDDLYEAGDDLYEVEDYLYQVDDNFCYAEDDFNETEETDDDFCYAEDDSNETEETDDDFDETAQFVETATQAKEVLRCLCELCSADAAQFNPPSSPSSQHGPNNAENSWSNRSVPDNTQQTFEPVESSPALKVHSRANLLEEIRAQIDLANEGGHMHTHVLSFLSKARATPVETRSNAQQLFLMEIEMSQLYSNPFSAVDSRVYVDASNIGIGFMFCNQWQAWRLKSGWKRRHKKRGRPIRLAEAIAIELGIRSMIEAGVTEIVLRSDNLPVVEAIMKRSTKSRQFGQAVKRILDVCELYGVHLDILWIPGKINPADGPSRLRVGNEVEMFPFTIDIPPHLQDLVLPYVPQLD